ncbi:MAG: ABC transporter permease subunit, partial [Bradyrhizobium sp.]|nr:ABC transporter permease subunit [Bradyrhizobium sp.]
SLMYCGVPIGAALAAALGFSGLAAAWQTIFWIGGVVPLLLIPLLMRWLPEAQAFQRAAASVPLRTLFAPGQAAATLLLWLGYFFTLLVVYMLINWLPMLLVGQGFRASQAAGVMFSLQIGAACGTLLLGALMDKLSPLWMSLLIYTGMLASLLIWPLVWVRDQLQASHQPVWTDLALTAIVVTALVFVIGGGSRALRSVVATAATFAGIALVIAIMGLDRGGLPIVDTRLWGGMLVTLVVSVIGIVASMPIGIALALGRRSTIPLIRLFSIAFIELVRGVPLITVLFFATYMLPLFLPGNMRIDGLVRALVGVALFSGAYMAEVIRGGLQAIPRGQAEAASALGLSWWKTTSFIVLPQALRHVIPGIVNSFISLFKDTSLVSIVALFDLLGSLKASFADPVWATPTTAFTGFAFTGLIYFVFCFGMSRYSLLVERRLNAHRRH